MYAFLLRVRRAMVPAATIAVVAALSFGASALAATFSEPAGSPPANNAYAPLDTSPNANTKPGTLTANSFCVGTSCLSPVTTTYGALNLSGLSNTWSGINYSSVGQIDMFHSSYTGVFESGSGQWDYYWQDTGRADNQYTLMYGMVPLARIPDASQTGQPLYVCPQDYYTGSGAWASIGCLGQVSNISYCRNIWWDGGSHNYDVSCTYIGRALTY